jgi:hypothetical protein
VVSVSSAQLPLPSAEGVKVELLFADVPGGSVYNARGDEHTACLAGCTAIALVYDVANRETFNNARVWLRRCVAWQRQWGVVECRTKQTALCGGQHSLLLALLPRTCTYLLVCSVLAAIGASWKPCGVVIGNKADLREADRAEVPREEAAAFADSIGFAYFETAPVS